MGLGTQKAPGNVADGKWGGRKWLFLPSTWISGLGGDPTGMAKRALREDVEAGRLPSYHMGGLWPEIILLVGGTEPESYEKNNFMPKLGAGRHCTKATGEGHSLGSGRHAGSLHWRIQAAYPSHSGKAPHLSLLWGFQKEVNLFSVLAK